MGASFFRQPFIINFCTCSVSFICHQFLSPIYHIILTLLDNRNDFVASAQLNHKVLRDSGAFLCALLASEGSQCSLSSQGKWATEQISEFVFPNLHKSDKRHELELTFKTFYIKCVIIN